MTRRSLPTIEIPFIIFWMVAALLAWARHRWLVWRHPQRYPEAMR